MTVKYRDFSIRKSTQHKEKRLFVTAKSNGYLDIYVDTYKNPIEIVGRYYVLYAYFTSYYVCWGMVTYLFKIKPFRNSDDQGAYSIITLLILFIALYFPLF